MSGLFLNFYQTILTAKAGKIDVIDYSSYNTKEAFRQLKETYPDVQFYRDGEKILLWTIKATVNKPPGIAQIEMDLTTKPRVLCRIIENAIVAAVSALGYQAHKNKYSNCWDLIATKDLLESRIEGLSLHRVVHFSSNYFFKEGKLMLGFSLATSLKNTFTWGRDEFERFGIDVKGLKGREGKIHADLHSLKRFFDTRGVQGIYDNIVESESGPVRSFQVIDKFYKWLDNAKGTLQLPFNLSMEKILKRYLPFEDNLVRSEIIAKPERYFYSNRKNTQGLKYYDQMVKSYQPYSLELYQNRPIAIGVICPKEYQGETEGFVRKIEAKLKEDFHFNQLSFFLKPIDGKALENYKEVLYDDALLKCQLIYVIVNQAHEKLSPDMSPYYYCKAKLIGNGIPTQDVQIETIRQKPSPFTMTNIALNSYAKLGGTAWTIEKEDKLKDELVVGIGSTLSAGGQHVLGIAQIFHNDGRYMTGNCSPLSTFDNYAANLEEHLYKTLKPLVEQMSKAGSFRLIFHLFKSSSEEYEIKAVNGLKQRLAAYDFEFALVHLGYGHNFRLYNNDGQYDIRTGTYIQLSQYTALLHFVAKSDLPLKIELDKRSTFTSLFYIAKQVYWFSHLSHRSYMPSKRTVTIMYPSLMARMTEELKMVSGWDYDRLKAVSEKLWFI
ncbi:MAG: hypothetical protein J0I41_22720 [Filimonas sp.]|nr:hypothetical protein [Filimonas sp.]